MASRGPTPMALAKQKYGPSVWRGMSAADKAAAIDAHQEDFRARVRSPGRSTAVRARSPLAVPSRSPPRTPGPPQRGGAAVAGSLSDMNALLGTLQATNALSDGHAAQLGALQEAVVSSMLVVEQEMDKLHKQTEAQLVRLSATRAPPRQLTTFDGLHSEVRLVDPCSHYGTATHSADMASALTHHHQCIRWWPRSGATV